MKILWIGVVCGGIIGTNFFKNDAGHITSINEFIEKTFRSENDFTFSCDIPLIEFSIWEYVKPKFYANYLVSIQDLKQNNYHSKCMNESSLKSSANNVPFNNNKHSLFN